MSGDSLVTKRAGRKGKRVDDLLHLAQERSVKKIRSSPFVWIAQLQQARFLKLVIESLQNFNQHVELQISTQGIQIKLKDLSMLSYVCVDMAKELFTTWTCPERFALVVDLKTFNDTLGMIGNDDFIELSVENCRSVETISIQTINNKVGCESKYTIPLMSVEVSASTDVNVPEMIHDVIVQLPSDSVESMLTTMSKLGETVVISVDKNMVVFQTNEDKKRSASTRFITTEYLQQETGLTETAATAVIQIVQSNPAIRTWSYEYSLRHLKWISGVNSLSKTVELRISNTYPMIYQIFDESNSAFLLKMFIAPKVDDADEENTRTNINLASQWDS